MPLWGENFVISEFEGIKRRWRFIKTSSRIFSRTVVKQERAGAVTSSWEEKYILGKGEGAVPARWRIFVNGLRSYLGLLQL